MPAAFLALATVGELRGQAYEQSSPICPDVSDRNYWSPAFAIDGDLMVVGAPHDSSCAPIGAGRRGDRAPRGRIDRETSFRPGT